MAGSGSIGAWIEQGSARTAARAAGVAARGLGSGGGSKVSSGTTATLRPAMKPVTVVGLPNNTYAFEDLMGQRGRRGGGGGASGGGGSGGYGAVGLTRGAAPAVVKIISFGHGGKRASAIALYVLREEVKLETYDGRVLSTQEQVGAEMKAWAQDFDARRESDDVVKVRLWLTPVRDQTSPVWQDAASREASGEAPVETPEEVAARRIAEREVLGRVVAAGFAGHRYAFAMGEDQVGRVYADVVSVMTSRNRIVKTTINEAGQTVEKKFPERLRMVSEATAVDGRRALNEASEKLLFDRISQGTEIASSRVRLQVSLPGHGVSGAQNKLDQLIQKGAAVRTETGAVVSNVAETAKLAKSWKRDMHSHGGRDLMHAMISARANENVESFTEAVRAHLATQFADHKYTFGIHTDKAQGSRGHIHAHVLVAVKSQSGVRYNPNKEQLLDWRQSWAEVARAHGLRIVATQAMTQANTQTYGDRDKAIIEVADRPRPERAEKDQTYARRQPQVVEQARRRVEAARTNAVKVPVTPEQRVSAEHSLREWQSLQAVQPFNPIVAASLTRLEASTRSFDLAERAARLDPEALARIEAAERHAAATRVRQAETRNAARQAELAALAAYMATLPIDSHAMRGKPAQPVMTVKQVMADYGRELIERFGSLHQFGQVKTDVLDDRGNPKMALSAAKMKQDLAQANEDIGNLSAMLTGADRMEFDQRAATILNTLTGVTKIQTFKEETGRDKVTRAEFFELAGPAATTLLDNSNAMAKIRAEKQALATKEAERLQALAVQRVQRDASSPARDAATVKRNEDDRRVMRDTDKLVNEANMAVEMAAMHLSIDKIHNDESLSYDQKLAAVRLLHHPGDTYKAPVPQDQLVNEANMSPEMAAMHLAIDKIHNDKSLSYDQKLAAVRLLHHPGETFKAPMPQEPSKPIPVEQQMKDFARENPQYRERESRERDNDRDIDR